MFLTLFDCPHLKLVSNDRALRWPENKQTEKKLRETTAIFVWFKNL